MVHNGVSKETIRISVMVFVVFLPAVNAQAEFASATIITHI